MSETTGAGQADDPRRSRLTITWDSNNSLIGRTIIGDELWCAVEWSEKRQAWCIEDAEGRRLSHQAHVHGQAAAKKDAVALAFEMIRDGRMPSPADARVGRRAGAEKRRNQPAQLRRRGEKQCEEAEVGELGSAAWRARRAEDREPPLYEALSDVFDFTDPELWRSNSFAALRPRLVVHVPAAVAEFEYRLTGAQLDRRLLAAQRREACRGIEAKLDRAREVLRALEDESGR